MIAKSAQENLGLPAMFFEGDIADEAFYKPELLETRLEALLETIDVKRSKMRNAA